MEYTLNPNVSGRNKSMDKYKRLSIQERILPSTKNKTIFIIPRSTNFFKTEKLLTTGMLNDPLAFHIKKKNL
jgi:hypothetical protein